MSEIGGYFELELEKRKEFHNESMRLNSGRNALYYLLLSQSVKKIFIPYYVCDAVLEAIHRSNTKYQYYSIDEKLEIADTINVKDGQKILYVNYFGLKKKYINSLLDSFSKKSLIIDNSQGFFSKPLANVDTFYSPRKFFGVPDGAYLYTNSKYKKKIIADSCSERISHLIERTEKSAEDGYTFFLENEKKFINRPLRRMSLLSQKILSSLNYEKIKLVREENFRYLHDQLSGINELNISISNLNGPMVYPLLIQKDGIKKKLIKNKIFIPTYWKEVLSRVSNDSYESKLTKCVVALPIDQRYDINEMNQIIQIFKSYSHLQI